MEDPHRGARAPQLIAILMDPRARADERDDAAVDLEFFSGAEVESALAETIRTEEFSSVLAQWRLSHLRASGHVRGESMRISSLSCRGRPKMRCSEY